MRALPTRRQKPLPSLRCPGMGLRALPQAQPLSAARHCATDQWPRALTSTAWPLPVGEAARAYYAWRINRPQRYGRAPASRWQWHGGAAVESRNEPNHGVTDVGFSSYCSYSPGPRRAFVPERATGESDRLRSLGVTGQHRGLDYFRYCSDNINKAGRKFPFGGA
jgi:hypothetical protein